MAQIEVELDTGDLEQQLSDVEDALRHDLKIISEELDDLGDTIGDLITSNNEISGLLGKIVAILNQPVPTTTNFFTPSATPNMVFIEPEIPYGLGEPDEYEREEKWNEAALRAAIERGLTVKFSYIKPPGRYAAVWESERSERHVRPRKIETIGPEITGHSVLDAFDLDSDATRHFRLDRIDGYVVVQGESLDL